MCVGTAAMTNRLLLLSVVVPSSVFTKHLTPLVSRPLLPPTCHRRSSIIVFILVAIILVATVILATMSFLEIVETNSSKVWDTTVMCPAKEIAEIVPVDTTAAPLATTANYSGV